METYIFAEVVSEEEWETVPIEIGKKISKFVNEKFEEFITSKALLETKTSNSEKSFSDLKEQNETIQSENESLKARLEAACTSITEFEAQVSKLSAELIKLQSQSNTLESEAAEYRHQRNLAVDERDEHLKMINRRNTEIERLQLDLTTITKQLEDAVNTKCEALAKTEEVASLKFTLEYKEKRLDQERSLLNSQIENLTEELTRRTDELLNMRRDNTSRCVQLETKLSEKTQELTVANEQVKFLTELNQNLTTRNEEVAQKMFSQSETNSKMNESYVCEIEAKTKMSNAYKTMYEESQQHAQELKEALSEVQELLRQATEQYGDLETKHKETELANDEIIAKKNDCIAMLKKELETANEIIEQTKNESIGKDLEGLSPSVSAASRLVKTGMTYTEVYSRYASVNEQLTNKEEECTRLNNYITCIVREIEEKGPLIKKLRQEYSDTLDANDALKTSNDSLLVELQQLRDANSENRRLEHQVIRENERMKKEIADLSRQVVHLLQEVEHSRIGSSSTSTDNDLSDSISSADIISKRLVTFNDISELQSTNQKLLALVRELTERQEEAESFDPASIANLQRQLEDLRESQSELLEEKDQQNKMMATVRNQRDMYKNLYNQTLKGAGDMSLDKNFPVADNGETSKAQSDVGSSPNYDEKMHDLEVQIDKYKKHIEQLKEEHETYRKERLEHEKILVDQIDSMRSEIKDFNRINSRLTSQSELNEDKFKVVQNNIEIYKKQIVGLEKQNQIYSESIIKHEQAETYLKNDLLQTQTKLSKVEVMLSGLQKENTLLRDAEKRLLKECEVFKKHAYQQNLLQSNIELIKATLERNDAESKLRLEAKLDEAHLECSSLRRRLGEEQDHFRNLSEHLEKQAKQATERMEEEKKEADKLRKEITEAREDLINKTAHIEDLSKKLKSSVFSIPDSTVEGRKLRELEQQLTDAQAEINSLKTKLKTTKESSEEYCNVAQAAEKQLKEVLDKEQSLQEEIDRQKQQIKELQEKCSELEGELSIQMDDQDISNANIKTKSQQLQEELNIRNMDLSTAKDQLEKTRTEVKSLQEQLKIVENKYAREVTLHSADLQSLTDLKAELDKALGQMKALKSEKERAEEALSQHTNSSEEQHKILNEEREKLEERFKNMDEQNALLLDQIQQLNTQLTILQAQASADTQSTHNTSLPSADTSLNRSLTEDDVNSSEQLLKIIKYLRQEKDIAVSKADIIEAEHFRLKSQFDSISKQLEESKAQMEVERQKNEVSVVSSSKHSEVLRKLETLNAITDSNRALRQERDELLSEITVLRARAEKLEIEVAPLQEKNRDLMTKADQMQTENISLRGECTRWRQRANQLIEKTNRTSPEDWKKLQTERETLAKQLTVERGNNAKLTEDNNVLRQNNAKLEEQLKLLSAQTRNQSEEINSLKEQVTALQNQVTKLTENLNQQIQTNTKINEENRVLTEDTAGKDVTITELKNNLSQVRKIAKKYKNQYEDQLKEVETLKQQTEQMQNEQNSNEEKQQQIMEQQKTEHEERVSQIEATHKQTTDQLNQQITSGQEQVEVLKKEIDSLKQTSLETEEKYKTLFKNAKERIVSLTEQNASLKEELSKKDRSDGSGEPSTGGESVNNELLEKINLLQQEKDELIEKLQQDKDAHTAEIESLNQRINQLERKLGQQQGSKPSTSSASSEKSSTERPTADIKPMAGHSTNTQTQSVPIPPWRSGAETPLASIRPMSQQLRTAAVLPTTLTPSAVMVPPQQQVHTTGSSSIEALSSSPTSSHTDYVPATSSASSAMLGPRQIAVPPTQSSEDDDSNMQVQAAPQQQALAVVSPRVEPPSSGSTQEQGTSSSSSNTVTTTQAGLKRQRDPDADVCQGQDQSSKSQQQSKRTRLQQAGTVSDSGIEVEYQVPTSSQRDHDDDNVIVVESDDEAGPDEGEGDDQDDPDDTEGYDDMEGMEQDNYEDVDCQEVEVEEEGGNEVEVIDDSSEVPNQSEPQESPEGEIVEQQAQSQAISSGTDGTGRSVPTTPLQSSPQESIPVVAEDQSDRQTTQSEAETPQAIVSGADEIREGSSEEVADQAGTSSEEARERGDLEGDDGVSSEGEKQPSTEEGEEEGREAEASQSTNPSRARNVRGNGARRSMRIGTSQRGSRQGPTPIIWGDQRNSPLRQHHDRGRSPQGYGTRTVARRARGRIQRPYGGRF